MDIQSDSVVDKKRMAERRKELLNDPELKSFQDQMIKYLEFNSTPKIIINILTGDVKEVNSYQEDIAIVRLRAKMANHINKKYPDCFFYGEPVLVLSNSVFDFTDWLSEHEEVGKVYHMGLSMRDIEGRQFSDVVQADQFRENPKFEILRELLVEQINQ